MSVKSFSFIVCSLGVVARRLGNSPWSRAGGIGVDLLLRSCLILGMAVVDAHLSPACTGVGRHLGRKIAVCFLEHAGVAAVAELARCSGDDPLALRALGNGWWRGIRGAVWGKLTFPPDTMLDDSVYMHSQGLWRLRHLVYTC
jgi:hypothetical protein